MRPRPRLAEMNARFTCKNENDTMHEITCQVKNLRKHSNKKFNCNSNSCVLVQTHACLHRCCNCDKQTGGSVTVAVTVLLATGDLITLAGV
ncbi:hypothetical protein J6590_092928 [Homalodisca vitripennis]|nr:hypothetical protein J6590_092928 [Homalodisca vitripennis]